MTSLNPTEDGIDEDGDSAVVRAYDHADISTVVEVVMRTDSEWGPGKPRRFGELRWRPHLSSPNRHLHVHLASELRTHSLDRLRACHDEGFGVDIAMPIKQLYDEDQVERLIPLEPRVHLLRNPEDVDPPEPLLCALGKRVRVSADARTRMARLGWELAQGDGTTAEKGARLEALLCFLFGQVADFEVSETRLNTATEEIDLVITVRATTGRCWVLPGAPFILVEAKNWHSSTVGQTDISSFMYKATHKRNTTRLGVVVGTLGFSSEARNQTLRSSGEDFTAALIGPDELDRWIHAEDGDDELETLVRRAMLS